jgi:hypothetical protein
VPANTSKDNKIKKNEGIQIISPKANEEVSSPIKIIGYVNGDGWSGFEGQVGIVKLLDAKGDELASGILTATTEWTTLPTNFETTLNFISPSAQSGTLVFHNENASGLPEKDKTFVLPVKINSVGGETSTVKLYFIKASDSNTCKPSSFTERVIPKTQAIARATLEELLKGPTSSEVMGGFSTIINPGVKIQSLTIDDKGVARADFSQELESTGGSCRVTAIRAEITQTLKQFSTIKNVIISINGEAETILQP